jgi:hypothetical protein
MQLKSLRNKTDWQMKPHASILTESDLHRTGLEKLGIHFSGSAMTLVPYYVSFTYKYSNLFIYIKL